MSGMQGSPEGQLDERPLDYGYEGSPPLAAIIYCTRCKWLARASWMAQELLQTFDGILAGVTLIPDTEGGRFIVAIDDDVVWDRKVEGGFPDIKALKQRVRDKIAPEQNLGHADCD